MEQETKDSLYFGEGDMWEGYGWEIAFEEDCSENGGGEPCEHCHSDRIITHTRSWNGTTYTERRWTCPRVVVGYNEGGQNSTGICLDCILEAAAVIDKGDRAD
jgi:hypothetical protein